MYQIKVKPNPSKIHSKERKVLSAHHNINTQKKSKTISPTVSRQMPRILATCSDGDEIGHPSIQPTMNALSMLCNRS